MVMDSVKTPLRLHPEEPENGLETLYRTIRDRICLGDLKPGDVLSENALAAELGVSRTPIRRVLQRLELEDLVTTKDGLGTIVMTLDIVALKEVYDLRMKLAELLGELCPRVHVSEAHLEFLRQLLERCKAMYDQREPRELVRINMEFHEKMMELVTNRPLRKFFSQLYNRTSTLWLQLLPGMDWDEEVRAMEQEFGGIVECLRANDMRGAGLIWREHIERSLRRITTYLGGT